MTIQQLDRSFMTKGVFAQLDQLKTSLFTGSLSINPSDHFGWIIYFRLGRIIWATGGDFPYKRWRRHLTLFCPSVTEAQLKEIATKQGSHQEYQTLAELLPKGDSNKRQQLVDLVGSAVAEVLFDIIQHATLKGENFSYSTNTNDTLSSMFTLITVEQACKQAVQTWQAWLDAGLVDYSPNLFPVIEDPEIIKQKTFGRIYQLIRNSVDGTENLRYLAVKSNQNIIELTKSLLPLVEARGLIFSQIPVEKKFNLPPTNEPELPKSTSSNLKEPLNPRFSQTGSSSPLVACVDDSPLVCQALEKILIFKGYRFLGIDDSIKAIPLLLKYQPNFIFLDLMMPVTNGYELCTQLRKTPSFKEVPIVILTGKDGLVDRMRAKLVGASGFLSKPVNPEQVLEMLEKYLIASGDNS